MHSRPSGSSFLSRSSSPPLPLPPHSMFHNSIPHTARQIRQDQLPPTQSLVTFNSPVENTESSAADAIDSILDDPANEQFLKIQPHSIRNMPAGCAVYNLLYSKQCFAEHPSWKGKKTVDQWTHGLMHGEYGGGFALDSTGEMERQFLHSYAFDIKNGITHYIIERRTPFFKFHADLDIKRKEPMDDENIVTLMVDFATCVRKFYPSTTAISRFDIVVCTSIGIGKTGIHVIFPNLIVNQNQAIDIRNYFVSYLMSKYGDMVGLQNSWEEIVDMSVYESNGLRMAGSNKTEECPECKGQKRKKRGEVDSPRRNVCTKCGGRYRIDSGKVYKPWIYIRNNKVHDAWTKILRMGYVYKITEGTITRAVIELCSTRCPNVNESSSDFAISDEDMINMTMKKTTNQSQSHSHSHSHEESKRPQSPRERIYKQVNTELGTYRMTEEDCKGMAKWKQKQFLQPRNEAFQLLQEFIQSKNFPSYWRALSIHSMFTNPKKTYYVINVRGEGQRYCLNNRKGSHNSNNVYFYVERGNIYQRCYCSCQTTENRKNGKCENFTSESISLTTKIDKVLFPVIDGKVGHLHSDRAMSAAQDLDEYTFRLATVISRMDESRNEYLEERRQRLNKKSDQSGKDSEEVDVQKRKRRRTKTTKPGAN